MPVPRPGPAIATTFEYVGSGGASVVGPVSGKVYQFYQRGASVVVDPRDAPALALVPQLRATRR
jgi:hypothetical protein